MQLRKSLYGLKQAGRAWYSKIDAVLLEVGFTRLVTDHCVYSLRKADLIILIALYVDDLLLLSNFLDKLNEMKRVLSRRFDMKDLGEVDYILGIQVERNRKARTLTISQREYVKKVLERYGMADCKPVATPLEHNIKLAKTDCSVLSTPSQRLQYQSAIGAVMYAMLGTRTDIAFSVCALSRFSSNPGQVHELGLKRLLRYLSGTTDYKITYSGSGNSSGNHSLLLLAIVMPIGALMKSIAILLQHMYFCFVVGRSAGNPRNSLL